MALGSTQLHSRLIRHSPVPQVHSIICLSESQAFPEAKSVESVDFTHFTLGENCDQTYLNLQFYFITYILLLLNTGGKEFIEIKKGKSICFQTIKSLRTGQ